jgi:hypothetical protein
VAECVWPYGATENVRSARVHPDHMDLEITD